MPDSPEKVRRDEDKVKRGEIKKKNESFASFPEMKRWIDRATA